MNKTTTFIGRKITLRALEPEDLELLYTIENDVSLWHVGSSNVPYSRYALKQFIAQNTNDVFADRQIRLMIEKNNTRQAVGMIDFMDFNARHHRAEIGIIIAKEYQKKGYGTEALELIEDYACQIPQVHQLYAYVSIHNHPSEKLFRQAGYEHTCTLKKWVWEDGAYSDVMVFQKFL